MPTNLFSLYRTPKVDGRGFFYHPDLDALFPDECTSFEQAERVAKVLGYELCDIEYETDSGPEDDIDLTGWEPMPEGYGWQHVGIIDTEDAIFALFVRPLIQIDFDMLDDAKKGLEIAQGMDDNDILSAEGARLLKALAADYSRLLSGRCTWCGSTQEEPQHLGSVDHALSSIGADWEGRLPGITVDEYRRQLYDAAQHIADHYRRLLAQVAQGMSRIEKPKNAKGGNDG